MDAIRHTAVGALMITWTPLLSASDAMEPADPVTEDTFIRAEVDARILRFQEAGGMNKGLVFSAPTPTDQQPVPRMNRDTLYAGVPIDTKDGFTVTVPESPADRYLSVYLIDNDHYTIGIISEPGTHSFEAQATRHIIAIPRVQVFDARDDVDVEVAYQLLTSITFESGSHQPKTANWDWEAMMQMREGYERQIRTYTQYPDTFQDTRQSGKVDPEQHRIAVAGAWGLFPNTESVYISYTGPTGEGVADNCYSATYAVPENRAFWSITMYEGNGYMFSDNATLNASNTRMNPDGTFTAYYGSEEVCGDVKNRIDVTDGWNFLMRVYLPAESVIAGQYRLPDVSVVQLRNAHPH